MEKSHLTKLFYPNLFDALRQISVVFKCFYVMDWSISIEGWAGAQIKMSKQNMTFPQQRHKLC